MLDAITTLFEPPAQPAVAAHPEMATTGDKGHGRLEVRTLERSAALNAYLDWPSVGQGRHRTCQRVTLSTGVITQEVTYGLSSLPPHEASAAQIEALWRGHWTIESRVHYVRDVTWGEDAGQVRQGHAPQALAGLRNGSLSLVRARVWTRIADATRHDGAFAHRAFPLLSLPPPRL